MPKEIAISLWEHTKEEASKLLNGTTMLIYNPITNDYKIEHAGKHSLARDKHAVPQLKYFTFEEVKSEH